VAATTLRILLFQSLLSRLASLWLERLNKCNSIQIWFPWKRDLFKGRPVFWKKRLFSWAIHIQNPAKKSLSLFTSAVIFIAIIYDVLVVLFIGGFVGNICASLICLVDVVRADKNSITGTGTALRLLLNFSKISVVLCVPSSVIENCG